LKDFIDEFGTFHQNWGVHLFAVGEWMGGQLDEWMDIMIRQIGCVQHQKNRKRIEKGAIVKLSSTSLVVSRLKSLQLNWMSFIQFSPQFLSSKLGVSCYRNFPNSLWAFQV